jgi:hypothetical protein
VKAKKKRIQASGAANRKRRRERLAKMYDVNAKLIALPSEVIKMPWVGKLQTISDWHVQIAKIYRRMLSGQIPEHVGTKLVYVCTAGASLAKMLQELRELEGLRQQLEQLQAKGFISREAVEYLPANEGGRE